MRAPSSRGRPSGVRTEVRDMARGCYADVAIIFTLVPGEEAGRTKRDGKSEGLLRASSLSLQGCDVLIYTAR